MKYAIAVLCLALAPIAGAKTVLPDACGDDKVQFEVRGVDDHSQPLTPDAGKALVVFTEEGLSNHVDFTTRYGIDGTWAGATHGNSYFLVQVTPGQHHLCAAPQGHFGITGGQREHLIGATSFTAEAGKVYFFGSKESSTGTPGQTTYVPPAAGSTGPGQYASTSGSQSIHIDYYFLSDDEGRFRVKAGKLAVAKTK